MQAKSKMLQFSVVIPAYNEEKYIYKTLRVLRIQRFTDFEIIVKDGGSHDQTIEIAKKFADQVVCIPDSSAAEARNQGAKYAKGEILVFIDADTYLPSDILAQFNKLMKNEQVVGVSCRKIPQSKSLLDRFFYEFVNISTFVSCKMALGGAHGNCMLVRRRVFEQIGGFNPNIIVAEEQDLVRRALKFGRYVFLLDSYVVENTRRLRQWGRLKLYKAWFTGMFKSFETGKRQQYEKVR
jgi:glycosyltransferase involved in cell wall biosynthesis